MIDLLRFQHIVATYLFTIVGTVC